MPPVPLPVPTPNFPFSNIANVVPHTPNDPPSVADVIAAKNYAQRALTAAQYPQQIDDRTTSGALVYAHSILGAASGGAAAPPWFADALNLGLNPINTRLDAIEDRLHEIDTRLDNIVTKIDQLTIFASQNHNRTLGDGRPVAFKPVAFPDGSLPSENDNTPTALTNLAVLDNLSYEELRAYCEAYYPGRAYGNGQRLLERKKSIREAIGCTAEPGTVRIRRWFPRESGQVCLVEIAQFSTQQDWPRGSRWLDGKTNQGDAVGPDANILSFLGGPKTCLRWRFAVLEMQVIYCELVRKFAFAAPDNEPPQTRLMTALLPMDSKGERPLPLRITRVL